MPQDDLFGSLLRVALKKEQGGGELEHVPLQTTENV